MTSTSTISLLPQPRQVEVLPGACSVRRDARVVVHAAEPGPGAVAEHFVADVQARAGVHLRRAAEARPGDIELRVGAVPAFGDEAYELLAETRGVRLTAPTAHGLWNATRTLLQLAVQARIEWLPPADDAPGRPGRVLHFDVLHAQRSDGALPLTWID